MKLNAVLLAAGTGDRFGGPKQLAPLLGRPVLAHALSDILSLEAVAQVAIVVPPGTREAYEEAIGPAILARADRARIRWADGGMTRRDSVLAGLRAISGAGPDSVVLVHDAARPYVSARVVDDLLAALGRRAGMEPEADGAVPVLPVADTLRWRDEPGGPDRASVLRVQTPQAFVLDRLEAAHAWGEHHPDVAASRTDDAGLVEAAGGRIAQVAGDARAEKITRPEDLAVAAVRLRGAPGRPTLDVGDRRGGDRTGFGLDHHRLAAGRPLWLCGIEVPADEGLEGHSDGDVALHAVINAMLGAIGAPDIGTFFPPDDPALAGIASATMTRKALREVTARGFEPIHAQVVLTAQRPRLKPHVPAMVQSLSRLLGLSETAVAVHATTGEGLFKGAIEAHAIVSVCRTAPCPGNQGVN